jgi:hypothetical protein
MTDKAPKTVPAPEREFQGAIWKHPYFMYIWISMIPFFLLLILGWLALKYHWLPNT